MEIIRDFEEADRYVYDFGPCSCANGFAQIDTEQDASYYGMWASPTRRMVVSYCEGDVTITKCATDAEFVDEIRRIADWNLNYGWGPIKIDPGLGDDLPAAFKALGLGDLLH